MNVLDEQVREDQRLLLAHWRIPFRQIGKEIAPSGIKDANIIPLLHKLKHPTLFTHDQGFFARYLVHPFYCLVWLDVADIEAASYIRRFLRHRLFDTHAKRVGTVVRVSNAGLRFRRRNDPKPNQASWNTMYPQ